MWGYLVIGLVAGSIVSSWQGYKDPPWEGFVLSKFVRSILIGGGWVFRPTSRVGFQVFAAQHAAAMGDIQRADGLVPDVIGNFWSLGAAIVIR